MDFNEIVELSFKWLAGIGLLTGGIGYAYKSFFKGKQEEKTDVMASANALAKVWQDQAESAMKALTEDRRKYGEQIETLRKEYSKQINELSREVGELKGQLTAEKNLRERAETILKDRNPETEAFMKFMLTTQKEVLQVLKEIHQMTKDEHDRDFKMTATITKEPVVN